MLWTPVRIAGAIAAAAYLAAAGVHADAAKPFPDFTFKRLGPPKPGASRRITVQIEPKPELPEPELHAAARPDPATEPAKGAFGWYWSAVSPDLAAATPGRLEQALRQLDKGPGVPVPRLQSMQTLAERYGIDILAATVGTKVSPALVLAVIGIESGGRVDAVSSAGAAGLMQLMPATATRFGVTDRADAVQNIAGGVKYLDWLMGEFGGDPILVLASYNAGEGAVRNHGGVPPYAETRAYVPKVLAAWTVARGLCLTPPVLISDGCALAVAGSRRDG